MTEYRQEQIEQAAKRYVKDIVTPLPASLMTAYINGAEYADQNPIHYDGKAMLHVLNKGHEQGYRKATDNALIWLEEKYEVENYFDKIDIDGSPIFNYGKFEDDFKQAMEESK